MEEILLLASAIALVVSGTVEAVKLATNINKRYLPLLAIVIGIVIGALAYFLEVEIGIRMWAGGVAGLAATGLFEGLKNIKERD